MLHGAATADRSRLAGRDAVSASVMEEVMEVGSLKVIMDDLRPSFVVIGESSELNLNRGGRGRAELHPETIGRPAHSPSPPLGVHAAHAMLPLIQGGEGPPPGREPPIVPALPAPPP